MEGEEGSLLYPLEEKEEFELSVTVAMFLDLSHVPVPKRLGNRRLLRKKEGAFAMASSEGRGTNCAIITGQDVLTGHLERSIAKQIRDGKNL